MNELPALSLVFAIAATGVFLGLGVVVLFTFVLGRDSTGEPTGRVFGPLTPLVAGLLPSSAAGRVAVAKDLLRAGFFEPVAPVNFTAIRSLMTYIPLAGGEVGAVLTDGGVSVAYFILGAIGGVLGYAVPRIVLAWLADARSDQIRRGLPMLMDTLGLTLSTGASLSGALAAAGEAIRRGYPDLSHEVRVVGAQAEMRSLSHALDAWRDRQPLPELGSMVFLLGQADRLGTDITRGLWELSGSLQMSARQRAEAAANRANFYMTFPTVLCLLIAAGLVLAGPGVAQVIRANREAQRYIQEAKDQQGKIRPAATPPGERKTLLAPPPAPPLPPGL